MREQRMLAAPRFLLLLLLAPTPMRCEAEQNAAGTERRRERQWDKVQHQARRKGARAAATELTRQSPSRAQASVGKRATDTQRCAGHSTGSAWSALGRSWKRPSSATAVDAPIQICRGELALLGVTARNNSIASSVKIDHCA